jgi:hypothetical protein
MPMPTPDDPVQLEIQLTVLCRLLREKSLVASDYRCLNLSSNHASWLAIKQSLKNTVV